jgi:hypothetical protein
MADFRMGLLISRNGRALITTIYLLNTKNQQILSGCTF